MKLTEWEKNNLKLTIKQLGIKLDKELQIYQDEEVRKFQERIHKGLWKIISPYKKIFETKANLAQKTSKSKEGGKGKLIKKNGKIH